MNDESRATWKVGWPGAVLASLAILGLFLFMASRTSLWDRDEGWYCRATAEMVESGNYLYPTYNDAPFLEKPILTYWAMALGMRLLGPTELGCRLFPAIGMAVSCLLTWWIGRRLFDARTGLWAMAITATSLMVLIVGQLAFTDCIMLPFLFGAVACFVASLRPAGCHGHGAVPWPCEEPGSGARCVRPLHLIGLALTTGLCMLAKGPMGLVPLAIIGVTLWLARKETSLGWGYLLLCCVAVAGGCAMYAVWAVKVNAATGGEYFRTGLGQHVIGRVLSPMQGHGGKAWKYVLFLPFYVPVAVIAFYPWVLHLGGAASALLAGRLGGRVGRAFILASILPLFIAMTLAATKLPHYILPIWLGLSLAVAATIRAWETGGLADRDKLWLRRGAWLLGPMGAVGGLALIVGPWLAPLPQLRLGGAVVGLLTLLMTAAAVRSHLSRGPLASAKALVVGMAALAIAWGLLIAPGVEQLKGVPRLADSVNGVVPAGVPVAAFGFDEPSLHFYLDRHIDVLKNADAAMQWLASDADGILITTSKHVKTLETSGYRLPGKATIASVHMLNLGKFGWVDVLAIRRAR